MSIVEHLKHVLLDLRAAWVMWILLGLSVASVLLIAERGFFFRSLRDDVRGLARELDALLRGGRYREAIERMARSPSPEAAAVLAGLRNADLGPVAAEKAIGGALALERTRMERGLAFLGTLGNNAPFIGLLGTVIGIIEAFDVLGRPEGAASAGGALAPQAIMSSIAEALVATAVGLFVAIPAVAAFNYFQRRIATILAGSEALTSVLLAHLNAEEPLVPAPAGPPADAPARVS
jgi:biopolymer transport protein ExbB/TolQ